MWDWITEFMNWCYRVLLSVIGLLILLASLAESWRIWSGIHTVDPKRDGLSIRMLLCFSAINNGRKLLSTKTGAGNLTCLNGIRFLSTTWVVMGHFFLGLASNGPNKFLLLEVRSLWFCPCTLYWQWINWTGCQEVVVPSLRKRDCECWYVFPYQWVAGRLFTFERTWT